MTMLIASLTFVIFLIIMMFWISSSANGFERRINEIKDQGLLERMDFFYSSAHSVIWIIVFCAVELSCVLLMWSFFRQQELLFGMIFLCLGVIATFFLGPVCLKHYRRLFHIREPAITLFKMGFQFEQQFYSWAELESMETLPKREFQKNGRQIVERYLNLYLKQGDQITSKRTITIYHSEIKGKWFFFYAPQYFFHYQTEKSTL